LTVVRYNGCTDFTEFNSYLITDKGFALIMETKL